MSNESGDPDLVSAFSTMHHIRDVLVGETSQYKQPSSSTVIQAIKTSNETPAVPHALSVSTQRPQESLMDEVSPTMESASFPPYTYPKAPPTSLDSHHRDASLTSKYGATFGSSAYAGSVTSEEGRYLPSLPKVPAHSHQRSGSNSGMPLLPDSNTWHSSQAPSFSQFPPASFPRVPPPASRSQETGRPVANIPSPLTTQGDWISPVEHRLPKHDPLGVLF